MKHIVIFLILAMGSAASAQSGVDLRDLRDYSQDSKYYDQLIQSFQFCRECWPKGVTYMPYGTTRDKEFTHDNVVYWSVVDSKTANEIQLSSLISYHGEMFVRRSLIAFDGRRSVSQTYEDIPVQAGSWSIHVNGISRDLVLSHSESGFEVIVPIVVGGFDVTETELKLPPENTYASTLDIDGRDANWYARYEPVYYQGYPFIKLMNSNGYYTAYGIHAPMEPGAMKRGFWSTGCIRIRIMDLYPIHYLVDALDGGKIQVTSKLSTAKNSLIHPYPLWDSKYKRVNKSQPVGDDGLSNMEIVEGQAPTRGLK